MSDKCGSAGCGICYCSGRDYRAMHWWPQAILSSYTRSEQSRGMGWWFVSREDMIEALNWTGP